MRWAMVEIKHAAVVVAERVGSSERLRDSAGARAGTHDVDIALPDGRLIALEVTTIADPKVQGPTA